MAPTRNAVKVGRRGASGPASGPRGGGSGFPRPSLATGWILAALGAGLALAVTFDPKLYVNGDNIDYMFLARAVRAGSLWPSDKYPPLFPALLAPVQALFGLRLVPQKLLVLAFGLASVWMLLRIARRRFADAGGPWIFWASATLIPVVEFSHYTMSEVPYLFFSLGAIDACDGCIALPKSGGGEGPERPGALGWFVRRWRIWAMALWVGAAFYTRSAGLALAAGVVLVLLMQRMFRTALLFVGALFVLGLPWLMHSLSVPGGNPYLRQFLLNNPYYPEFGCLDFSSLLRRLRENGTLYFLKETPGTIFPLLYNSTYSAPGEGYFPYWIGIPLFIPFLAGLIRGIQERDPAAAVLLCSLLLSLVWPIIWAGSRFLVPVVPFLFLFSWKGWGLPEKLGWPGPWRRVRQGLLVLLVLLGLRNLVFYKLETRAYPPVWGRYFAALDWIRENTPRDAVIIDRKPGFVEYVTERKSVAFPREKDPDRMLQDFREKGASYVVLSALPYDDILRYLKPVVENRRDFFDPVAVWHEPGTYVLRFYPEGKADGRR